jgi:hypothetical protein
MLQQLDTLIGFVLVLLLLSLVITIVVQMVSHVLNLRGQGLEWAVTTLFEKIDPQAGHTAEGKQALLDLAKSILRDKALTPSKSRSSSAVRKDELVRLLAEHIQTVGSKLPETSALKALVLKVPQLNKHQVESLLSVLPPTMAADVKAQVGTALGAVTTTLKDIETGISEWFTTVMDRSSEWFAIRMRSITAITAVLLCFILQIDSLRIIQQISSNAALRARLVESVEGTLRSVESGALAQSLSDPAIASDALDAMKAEVATHKDHAALRDKSEWKDLQQRLGTIPRMTALREGEKWLEGNVPAQDLRDTLLKIYDARYKEIAKDRLRDAQKAFGEGLARLDQTQLEIIPAGFSNYALLWDLRHFLGTLFTALLLALGAPFWFNVLRQLTTLRPMLANKVEEKPESKT